MQQANALMLETPSGFFILAAQLALFGIFIGTFAIAWIKIAQRLDKSYGHKRDFLASETFRDVGFTKGFLVMAHFPSVFIPILALFASGMTLLAALCVVVMGVAKATT